MRDINVNQALKWATRGHHATVLGKGVTQQDKRVRTSATRETKSRGIEKNYLTNRTEPVILKSSKEST